ncbi:hypothetical protein [Microvirga soli]|uniref:hypothetical protein n=1 Tax=Microvirga soli TaxID=1854496 RepID=UPI00191EEC6A|nr:hypothetical protein [Microvirga soli]
MPLAAKSQEPSRKLVVGRCRLENRVNLESLSSGDLHHPGGRSLDPVWGVGE